MFDDHVKVMDKALVLQNFQKLPGLCSTYKDPMIAISFAKLTNEEKQKGMTGFLFLFTMNSQFCTFSIDSREFTCYPYEKEVALAEGTMVRVLAREEVFSSIYDQYFSIFHMVSKS